MTEPKHNSQRRALWGIVALFTVAGASAGFAGGQVVTRAKAIAEVDSIRTAYAEADKARSQALDMCLRLAPKAALSAADAAKAAKEAAKAASKAAQNAEKDE